VHEIDVLIVSRFTGTPIGGSPANRAR